MKIYLIAGSPVLLGAVNFYFASFHNQFYALNMGCGIANILIGTMFVFQVWYEGLA